MPARRHHPHLRRPGALSGASWAAILAVSLAGGPGPALEEEKGDATPVAGTASAVLELEAELKTAMASQDQEQAKAAVTNLAATGAPEAYGVIIRNALTGMDYGLEQHAAAILGECQDPKARALIIESIASGSNWKTRIILLGVAAKLVESPGALDAVHAALKDPSRPVVLTALQHVRALNRRESVDPLVDALEEHEKTKVQDRVYHDIRNALEGLTGQDLEAAADWRSFLVSWKKGLTSPEKPRETRTVIYKKAPKFFSMDLDTTRVLFIIDVSGSMLIRDPIVEEEAPKEASKEEEEGEKGGRTVVVKKKQQRPGSAPRPQKEEIPITRERITRVRAELMKAITTLPPNTRFGILAFSHKLEWWVSRGLRDATSENRANATNWVRSLKAEGATRTDLALRDALAIPEVDTIFLLTDGAPRDLEGDGGTRIAIDPILERTRELNRFLKCRIHTISFKQIRDSSMRRFVVQLAEQNDGSCILLK